VAKLVKKNMYLKAGVHEVYDIATDIWSTKASPLFRGDIPTLQAYTADGKIFVRTLYELFIYDSIKDSWFEKTQIPYSSDPRIIVSAMVDDKIIVFQAADSAYPYNRPGNVTVLIYELKTDKWSYGKTQEIEALHFLITAGATTGIYAPKNTYILGFTAGSKTPTLWIYNPLKDTWTISKTTPPDIHAYGIAEVNDVLYIFGPTGYNEESKQFIETTMQYVPIGYSSIPYATPTPSNNSIITSEPEPTKTLIPSALYRSYTQLIIVLCVTTITVGLIIASLFFYLKKRN
jgi:hypothetical protein